MRQAAARRFSAAAGQARESGQGTVGPSSTAPPSAAEVADYVCEILAGLRTLTSDANMAMLTYLLDMAYEEAAGHRDDPGDRPPEDAP